jgi:hypothetical protein
MKKLFILLIVVLFALSGVSCDNDATPTVTYNLRDRGPAGGWIFYDKGSYSNGWRYMEAWTADESGTFQWRITGSSGTETTLTGIGTGYDNTYTSLANSNFPAAMEALGATHGGESDWFLPSKDELNKMWINLWRGENDDAGNATYTPVGSFAGAWYWSSSHVNSIYAWAQSFNIGTQDNKKDKETEQLIRVVRRF